MSETIYARFDDFKNAEQAAGALLDHGVEKDDLTLLRRDNDGEQDETPKKGITTTTGADAAAGAAKGAGIGAVVGAVAALASLTIPGFGLVYGGGALATAIGAAIGTAAGGAVAGGVQGFLQDQGIDKDVAVNYEKALERGGAILGLNLPSGKVTRLEADEILRKYAVAEINGARQFVTTR